MHNMNFSKSFVKPLFTLSLITALVISPLLFVNSQKVRAADLPIQAPPPVSAPPEPFILRQHSFAKNVFPAVSSYLEKLGSFINGPKVPEGFERVQPPTLTERIGAFLGFIAPKAAPAINMSAPSPPPP